ncbi:Rha family transcriptional regulator [Laribacter hongkongensis]|nr:Rha family transcriptional regulator [Laribacter hongkongensis]MCG9100158.1 Rha family transcriptional regulator [Laribacter hongkongensis]MCG9105008.1 Rha family transcriptional regulator [Laribacter hongkongensis]MCG9112147.1 Rha family transcriptional regulator [Laribacter hongkongensis]MCG9119012.1 Rha family transcriptional regulator [Laribacter hongkongensis]
MTMQTINRPENGLPVLIVGDEPRIDSRVLADGLGIENRALLQNIDKYANEFDEIGVVTFKTQKPSKGSKGGMPVRYALLTEDQAYFAVTLSRNTERAVEVKFRLVQAFSEARKHQDARHNQYLPFYHLAHDAARNMADTARRLGSEAPEQVFHSNVEKLINRAFGLEKGQRSSLSPSMQNAVSTAYQLVSAAIIDTLAEGGSHKAAYREAERRVTDFARLFGPVVTGRLAA